MEQNFIPANQDHVTTPYVLSILLICFPGFVSAQSIIYIAFILLYYLHKKCSRSMFFTHLIKDIVFVWLLSSFTVIFWYFDFCNKCLFDVLLQITWQKFQVAKI